VRENNISYNEEQTKTKEMNYMFILIAILIGMVCAVGYLSVMLVVTLLRDMVAGIFDFANKTKSKNGLVK